jgi:hypothetical protein
MLNTRRVQGKCDMIPVTSPWNFCAAESEDCEVSEMSIVRFGTGASFKYALVETNSTTGVGNIACSQRTFGLGSPGKRRCDAAFVGIPARIAGPEPYFVEHVELYARPRTNAGPVCQKCDGCIDSDGRVIRRNIAFGKSSVTWSDTSTTTEACVATETGVDDQLCAGVALNGTEVTCTGAGACTYTAGVALASTTAVVGDIANTIDGLTANSGIVGGNNLDSVCSTATGAGALTWSVDLGGPQTVVSVRVWSTLATEDNTDVTVSIRRYTMWHNCYPPPGF